MKRIYHETIRERWDKPYTTVVAYYHDSDEPLIMPALIYLETGHYDGSSSNNPHIIDTRAWFMYPYPDINSNTTEAEVIRVAIETMDNNRPVILVEG